MDDFDVVVIGAGPGGYSAAIRLAQYGKKVAIVEKGNIGGTCLNTGCIPTKVMIEHSHLVNQIKKANQLGIGSVEKPLKIDFAKLMKRKEQVVQQLTLGVESLLKKSQVKILKGEAAVNPDLTVTVGSEILQAKDLLLATGGTPKIPDIPGIADVPFLTHKNFFELKELPRKLVIIGQGISAVNLAFTLGPLGTEVTIVSERTSVLGNIDDDAAKIVKHSMESNNIRMVAKANWKKITTTELVLMDETIPFDYVLLAGQNNPNTDVVRSLNLEQELFLKVDKNYQTSHPHVFAIGDVIGGFTSAGAALQEGTYVAAQIAGEIVPSVQYDAIAGTMYSSPEVAFFGLNEKSAKEGSREITVAKSPLSGNGKALAIGETEGYIKLISDKEYGELLGGVVVAPNATDLISSLLTVKRSEGTLYELAHMSFPHPSISEGFWEAANSNWNQAIHM